MEGAGPGRPRRAGREGSVMMTELERPPRLPPRWFIRAFWVAHRGFYRLTGGRRGLWRPKPDNWGAMRIRSIGRRTGKERSAIVAYFEDGPNLVTLAMNGWAAPEPAWWLNLQAHPDVTVDLPMGGAPCTPARPRARSAPACGPAGARSYSTATCTPAGDPARRRSSSWSPVPSTRAG